MTVSDEKLKDLLPKITLKGEKEPRVQVWLSQKDALAYGRRVAEAECLLCKLEAEKLLKGEQSVGQRR